MNVSDFDFDLPDELIAQQARPRGTSRLLVLDRATAARRHATIADLPSILVPGDVLVVNNTRVIAARLLGRRVPSGGAVECLLLGPGKKTLPDSADGDLSANSTVGQEAGINPAADVRLFDALMHPGQKLKPGARVRFEGRGRCTAGRSCGAAFPRPAHHPFVGRKEAATSTRWSTRSVMCRCRRTSSERTAARIARGIRPFSRASRFGGGADRRPALHAGTPCRARRARRRASRGHAPRRLRNVQAGSRHPGRGSRGRSRAL